MRNLETILSEFWFRLQDYALQVRLWTGLAEWKSFEEGEYEIEALTWECEEAIIL